MKKFFRSIWPIRFLKIRYKVGLFFFLPVVLALIALIVVHYMSERRSIRDLAELSAARFGQITLSGLKHAMLMNDSNMVATIVSDAAVQQSIQKVRIVDLNGFVWQSSVANEVGKKDPSMQTGCVECHRLPEAKRPESINISSDPGVIQIAIPIPNNPDCAACHGTADKHLGMLIVDASMAEAQSQLSLNTLIEFLLSLAVMAIFMLMDFVLIQWLIVHRVEIIHAAVMKLGGGDFSARISQRWSPADEITQLAEHINILAANIEQTQARQEEKERVRAQAIIEERERIARELHDGVAQFLGYLSAKVAAIRLALRNRKVTSADQNLRQVESAIHDQSAEVRSSIIGLKISSGINQDLLSGASEYVDQCNRLGDLQLNLEIAEGAESIHLNNETTLQLFRILQEAVSNIRKHAHTTQGLIRFAKQDDLLVMTIQDNGTGFDPLRIGLDHKGHFGLQIMMERAQEIGAQLEIKSFPGQGTRIIVTVGDQEG